MPPLGNPEEYDKRDSGPIRPMPAYPMESLLLVEMRDRRNDFQVLQEQIARVELLGTDDARRMSYHKYPVEDGTRQVLFYGSIYKGVGRAFRVVVNDEVRLWNDARELKTKDYLINASNDIVTKQSGLAHRSHHQHAWEGIEHITAPFLRAKDNQVLMGACSEYNLALPFEGTYSTLDKMDMRQYMQEITSILSQLTEVTREDGVTNEQ